MDKKSRGYRTVGQALFAFLFRPLLIENQSLCGYDMQLVLMEYYLSSTADLGGHNTPHIHIFASYHPPPICRS